VTRLAIDALAEEIAGIFEHTGAVWGLALAGIPEHVPDANDVAEAIGELQDRPLRRARLVSDRGIVLVQGDPQYPDHIRVLLDVGLLPLPLPGSGA
jgi:hypothetical protein